MAKQVIPARHVHQFNQLRRLDPDAYRAAALALRAGLPALAGRITVNGMQRAFTRLSTDATSCVSPAPANCPEAVQKPPRTRCDARHLNPTPDGCKHVRCRRIARYVLTLRNTGSAQTYQVHRCQACRDELVAKAEAGVHPEHSRGARFVIVQEDRR